MTRPIRDRETFEALARAHPVRRGALSVRVVEGASSEPARVAYAVGRHAGRAVVRNRIRRRLRAAMAQQADVLHTGAAYLVGAGAESLTMPFDDLARNLGELTARAHRRPR